jgi:thymidylate kinase
METFPEVIQVLTLTLNLLKIVGVPGILSLMVLYPGLIIFLWVTHERQVRRILTNMEHRRQQILEKYGKDMQEIRTMYEKNVILVKDGGRREDIMQEILIKVTEALTNLTAELKGRRRV